MTPNELLLGAVIAAQAIGMLAIWFFHPHTKGPARRAHDASIEERVARVCEERDEAYAQNAVLKAQRTELRASIASLNRQLTRAIDALATRVALPEPMYNMDALEAALTEEESEDDEPIPASLMERINEVHMSRSGGEPPATTLWLTQPDAEEA